MSYTKIALNTGDILTEAHWDTLEDGVYEAHHRDNNDALQARNAANSAWRNLVNLNASDLMELSDVNITEIRAYSNLRIQGATPTFFLDRAGNATNQSIKFSSNATVEAEIQHDEASNNLEIKGTGGTEVFSLDMDDKFILSDNQPRGRWTRSSNQSISSGSEVAISWDTEDYDNDSLLTPTSGNLTIGEAGRYLFIASINWQSGSGTGFKQVRFSNSSGPVYFGTVRQQGDDMAQQNHMIAVGIFNCAAAETIQVLVEHNHGISINITAEFSAQRLLG